MILEVPDDWQWPVVGLTTGCLVSLNQIVSIHAISGRHKPNYPQRIGERNRNRKRER